MKWDDMYLFDLFGFAAGKGERATSGHDDPPAHAPLRAKTFQPTCEYSHPKVQITAPLTASPGWDIIIALSLSLGGYAPYCSLRVNVVFLIHK